MTVTTIEFEIDSFQPSKIVTLSLNSKHRTIACSHDLKSIFLKYGTDHKWYQQYSNKVWSQFNSNTSHDKLINTWYDFDDYKRLIIGNLDLFRPIINQLCFNDDICQVLQIIGFLVDITSNHNNLQIDDIEIISKCKNSMIIPEIYEI